MTGRATIAPLAGSTARSPESLTVHRVEPTAATWTGTPPPRATAGASRAAATTVASAESRTPALREPSPARSGLGPRADLREDAEGRLPERELQELRVDAAQVTGAALVARL